MKAQQTHSSCKSDRGFTLVELLVVISIIAIMAGMIVAAVRGVTRSAREARTRAIIEACDSVIQEKYNEYKFRTLAIDVPDTFQAFNNGTDLELGYEVLADEAARVRLMMIRDLQRMEMPDRLTDLASDPVSILAACTPVILDTTGTIRDQNDNKSARRLFPVSWYGVGDDVPAALASYRDRLSQSASTLVGTDAGLENQGAECLYLIMATTFTVGTPALDAIPDSNIGDTDGDGLPEILDGWGQPLGFIRWPVGFNDPYGGIDTQLPDPFDLFRADFAYAATVRPPPPTPPSAPPLSPSIPADVNSSDTFIQRFGWSMRPLIVSAGQDGEFGIALNPWRVESSVLTELTDFSYQAMDWFWPVTAAYYGNELPGRTQGRQGQSVNATLAYPDPYLRRFIAENGNADNFTGVLPGSILPDDESEEAAQDNLTNYESGVIQ